MAQAVQADIVILGGGVAGLWFLNILRGAGYQAILFEVDALGSGQTIHSQGMLHSGVKFSLHAKQNKAASESAKMVSVWSECFSGDGILDLSNVKHLSSSQYLWSSKHLASKLIQFLASKSLKSRVQKLDNNDIPAFWNHEKFQGSLYQVNETVLDVYSLIENLSKKYWDFIFKIPEKYILNFSENGIQNISFDNVKISAQHFVFTAGAGNEKIAHLFPEKLFKTQRRPLHMVAMKHPDLPPIYGHGIDIGMTPKVTISSHTDEDGMPVWYLGGELAESGVERNKQAQIKAAKALLTNYFPWLNLENERWETLFIDRAEQFQVGGKRPDAFSLISQENYSMAWPTKLVYTPGLGKQFLEVVQAVKPMEANLSLLSKISKPEIAKPFWQTKDFLEESAC